MLSNKIVIDKLIRVGRRRELMEWGELWFWFLLSDGSLRTNQSQKLSNVQWKQRDGKGQFGNQPIPKVNKCAVEAER